MSTYQSVETIGSPNFEPEALRVDVLRMAGVRVEILLPMIREEVTPPQVS